MGRPAAARPVGSTAALVTVALVSAACGTPSSAPGTTGSRPIVVRAPSCPPAPGARVPTAGDAAVRGGLADDLVPPGPVAAVACRYTGAGPAAVRTAVVSRSDLAALVTELDSPRWPVITRPATYFCPFWDGSTDVARFAYASGPDVEVTVDLGGCGFASNGVRTVGGDKIAVYLSRWVGDSASSGPTG